MPFMQYCFLISFFRGCLDCESPLIDLLPDARERHLWLQTFETVHEIR